MHRMRAGRNLASTFVRGRPSTDSGRSAVRVSDDGAWLDPPGKGRPFLARAQVLGADAQHPAAPDAPAQPRVLIVHDPADIDSSGVHAHGPQPDLIVLDEARTRLLESRGGPAEVTRAVSHARRRAGGALVACAPTVGEPFEASGASVLVTSLPTAPDAVGPVVLPAGLRAAGRPLLVDVRSPETDVDCLTAAVDVGAAGAIVRTGDAPHDRRLLEEAAQAEETRLDDAPLISVVVCNYNGARHLPGCLASLARVVYPRYEVIVCDDGSTDDSVAVASGFDVRVLELGRGGLSRTRNAGIKAANGELVAFLDADAHAELHWLSMLWRLVDRLGVEGVGGPNLPFVEAGWQERAISSAPGVAIPVVFDDGTCNHLAGCNMAFRQAAIHRAGGFDPTFLGANDDVDFSFRMLDSGGTLVYQPTATVRHHRRETVLGFLKQQRSYGAGAPIYEATHAGRAIVPRGRRRLRARLDPRRTRYVFAGPQARQIFTLASQPLHIGLPLKALAFALALAGATLPFALWLRRLRAWAAASTAAVAPILAVTARRVPVFSPRRGLEGPAQRVAAALLWFAQPAARWYGEWSGRRQAATELRHDGGPATSVAPGEAATPLH